MNLAAGPTVTLDAALALATRLLDSDPVLAGEQAAEILRAVPAHPVAELVLAAAHNASGHPARAAAILEALVRAQPRVARAHLELGIALGRLGRGDEALAALRRAVELKADLPGAWLALGDCLAAAGDDQAADAAYARHVRSSIRDPGLMQAAAALADNRIPEAERRLRDHLFRAPTDVVAIRMLAELAARLGKHEEAEALLARCLELAPGFHAARQHYALVLYRGNKPIEAMAEVDALLRLDPGNAAYLNLKAVLLCRVGDYDPAIDIYAGILRQFPTQSKLWMSQGHALKTAGRQAEAIAAYRRCLELDPGFGEAWWSLANLKTYRFSGADLKAMRAQLRRTDLATEHRFHFEFALGKASEDAAAFSQSFGHYERANALRRSVIYYNPDDNATRVRRCRRQYTREFFEARRGSGCQAPDPIFIVGMPRAGSTLLEQILSSHSAVEGTMELPEIISMTRELRHHAESSEVGPYHEALANLDADALRELGEQYLERTRVHRRSGAPFFIDKMPNNFAHIGLIHLALPNARIIDARRHPVACCFSNFKQHFARGQNFSYSLGDVGRYYRDYVEQMAHFDAVLPGRVHRVIHEHLVEDTEAEVRRLLEHCGLPFEEQCLRFYENNRPVRTASSEQVRRPINRDGLDQWRNYEAWLEPLKQALGPVLDAYPDAPDFAVPIHDVPNQGR